MARIALRVTVLTPTHIGSGEKLSNKAFTLTGGDVVVVDEQKLVKWVSTDRRRLDSFMTFAEDERKPLSDFLRQAGVTVDDFAAYRMRNGASSVPRDIQQFIKQPDHRPYLPGSSFRGALRSALLRGYFLAAEVSEPALAGRVVDAVRSAVEREARGPGQEAEAPIFVPAGGIARAKRPNYDVLRTVGFADTQSAEPSRLEVNEIRVLSAQTNGTLRFKDTPRGNQTMQIFAEMLQPGTVLRVPVTLNRALLRGVGAAGELKFKSRSTLIWGFPEYAKKAADNLAQQEVEFYEKHQRSDLADKFRGWAKELASLPEGAFLMPIGWGTGFDAKTLTDRLGDDVFEHVVQNYRNARRLGKPGGTGKWLGRELSPKSRKVVYYADGKVEPIGWLRVSVSEA